MSFPLQLTRKAAARRYVRAKHHLAVVVLFKRTKRSALQSPIESGELMKGNRGETYGEVDLLAARLLRLEVVERGDAGHGCIRRQK